LNSYQRWQQPQAPDFMPYLEGAAQIIKEHEITLDEDGILDLLQIKYRWPEPALEVINQCQKKSDGFFDSRGYVYYEKWKRLYDLGFTSLLSNIMDLTAELRSLDDKLFEYKGSETNANMYLSAGTTKYRASFDPHNHDYHVIVKPIYGLCTWVINGKPQDVDPSDVLIIPAGTMHAVVENKQPRLSLTMNLSG
tara:strand:- start:1165 stop:1746 length:582 start_codon:yes stop_codon:yes gene_type:complete